MCICKADQNPIRRLETFNRANVALPKDLLGSCTFFAPTYSGNIRLVFDKLLVELLPRSIGAPKFITILPTIGKKGEVLDKPRVWKQVANLATLNERKQADEQESLHSDDFGLHNYDNLWFDYLMPPGLIAVQLTLMFWRWNLLAERESESVYKNVRQFVAQVYESTPKEYQNIETGWKSEIVDEVVSYTFSHFRFPEGPYDIWAYEKSEIVDEVVSYTFSHFRFPPGRALRHMGLHCEIDQA